MPSNGERERLGHLLWDEYGRHLHRTQQTSTPPEEFPWEQSSERTRENYRTMVDIIVAALQLGNTDGLGEGTDETAEWRGVRKR